MLKIKKLLNRKLALLSVLLTLISLISLTLLYFFWPKNVAAKAQIAINECNQKEETDSKKIDCWYNIVRDAYRNEDVETAFTIFKLLYENSDIFVTTGCHRHAHRIGDTAYYESYLAHKDISKMDFPQVTSVCGYGFFHGFLEHMIQDRPDPKFVRGICDYLDSKYTSIMPAIRITCFHGSGHGFALSAVDTADKSEYGDPMGLVGNSLSLCETTATTANEIEECKEGVFNVIVEWMADEEYGLSYNREDPFWLCRKQKEDDQQACYYEMAQKADSVAEFSIKNAADLANGIDNQKYAETVFVVALAAFMQNEITKDKQFDYAIDCRSVPEFLKTKCLMSIVGGMFEHGNPGEEHVKAIELCDWDKLVAEEKDLCYTAVMSKLKRFHSDDKIASICAQYKDLMPYCKKDKIL